MPAIDLSEYKEYTSASFNSAQHANKLLLETNDPQDSTIDLDTAIKRLGFDLKDISSKIEEMMQTNTSTFVKEFEKVEQLKVKTESVKPSINQLKLSFQRLNDEIVKPYNQCTNLQMALKRIHQTNQLLRSLTYATHLLAKIEELDKSENALATKPFKTLNTLASLLREFSNYIKKSNLGMIRIIRDYSQFTTILMKRCDTVIQYQTKNLLKFPIQEYVNPAHISTNNPEEKSLFNIISASVSLDIKKATAIIELFYTASSKHSVNLILRNLNNTKYLPPYIRSLERPAKLVSQLEKELKAIKMNDASTSLWNFLLDDEPFVLLTRDEMENISLLDKFWRDVALGIDSGVKEIVNKGGPIVNSLKKIKPQLELEVTKLVTSSYEEYGSQKGKIETRMMVNSVTNFERRK